MVHIIKEVTIIGVLVLIKGATIMTIIRDEVEVEMTIIMVVVVDIGKVEIEEETGVREGNVNILTMMIPVTLPIITMGKEVIVMLQLEGIDKLYHMMICSE